MLDEPLFEAETGAIVGAKPWHAGTGIRESDLPWNAKLVAYILLSIVKPIHEEGWVCYPALPTIAKHAGISRSCVHRGLKELDRRHLIDWSQEHAGGGNRYVVDCEAMAALNLGFKRNRKPGRKLRRG